MHIVKTTKVAAPQLQLVKETPAIDAINRTATVDHSLVNSDSTDRELVIACQRADKRAFDILAKRYERAIRAHIYKLAPDWQNTHEDFAQEVLVRIWRSIHNLRNPAALKGWINQITTNLFYDELRKRPKMTIVSMDEPFKNSEGEESGTRDIPDDRAQPDEMMHRLHIVEQVNHAIEGLPEQFKNVIVLRELHGLPYEEIAVITKTELGTVKSRIARARQKLQGQLEPLRCA